MAWPRSSNPRAPTASSSPAPGLLDPLAPTAPPSPEPAAQALRSAARLAAARAAADPGPLSLTVRGGSMAPLLADGERLEVARAAWYWPGDLVAFGTADGRLLIHRLLAFRPWSGGLAAVTRGDACPAPDAPVPLSRLIGRVVGRPDLTPPGARVRALLAFLRLTVRRVFSRTEGSQGRRTGLR